MGDKKFTLLELHLDGPLSLGPSFGSDPEPDVESTASDVAEDASTATDGSGSTAERSADAEGDGAPVKGAILGVLAIVVLAVAARVLLGDDDSGDPELVDLEDVPDADDVEDDEDA